MAELAEIVDEIKRLALLAGVAIGALLLVGILLPVGLALFIGEWVFGSLGWGVLHGTLLLVAVAITAGLVALGTAGGQVARSVVIAIVLGLVVGLLCAFNLPNAAWTRIGESLGLGVDPAVRPLLVGIVVVGIAGAILGLLAGLRGDGAAPALGGGLVLGVLLGAFSAITFDDQAGAAVGVTVALLAWPAFLGLAFARRGFDFDAFKARFWPSVTIDTTRETIEWVRAQTPLGRRG